MKAWRTVITALFLSLVLLGGLLFSVHRGSEIAAAIFPHFAIALVALGGFVAGKSLGEKLAGGGGLKGAAAALFTAAKPEGTEPTEGTK